MGQIKRLLGYVKFFSYLGTDIRKKEVQYSLLPICSLPFTLWLHVISSQPMMIGFFILFLIFLFSPIPYGNLKSIKMHKEKKYNNYPTEDLFEIAKKLDPKLTKNPFRVIEKEGFVAATYRSKITISRNYLEKLDGKDEKSFVIAHELFHYRGKGEFWNHLIPTIGSILLFVLFVSLKLDVMNMIGFGGLLYLMKVYSDRSLESLADFQGVRLSSKEAAIKALEARYEIKKNSLFDSHPGLEIRIKNIQREFIAS